MGLNECHGNDVSAKDVQRMYNFILFGFNSTSPQNDVRDVI